MYFYENSDGLPSLEILFNEPSVFATFVNNFPFATVSSLYQLNPDKGVAWYNHVHTQIFTPNLNGSPVSTPSRLKNYRLFDEWIRSTTDRSLFQNVQLKRFLGLAGTLPLSMLFNDVYCRRCDFYDPAYVFLGTRRSVSEFHSQYSAIAESFEGPWFATRVAFDTCFICDPQNRYITTYMGRGGRRRAGLCECMPCRRGL